MRYAGTASMLVWPRRSCVNGEFRGPITRSWLARRSSSTFASLGLHPTIASVVEQKFGSPTAIQRLAIPEVISRQQDVVVAAETGTGKTLAYLLPILQRHLAARDGRSPHSVVSRGTGGMGRPPHTVILVPNKVLVAQTVRMLEELRPSDLHLNSGDSARRAPSCAEDRTLDVLISTPAAAADTVCGFVADVDTIVIDEADMLLTGAYQPHTKRILDCILKGRRELRDKRCITASPVFPQLVFVGATLPSAGTKSVRKYLNQHFPRAAFVETPLLHRHLPSVKQELQFASSMEEKVQLCVHSLRKIATAGGGWTKERVLVFVSSATQGAEVAELLKSQLPDTLAPRVAEYHKLVSADEREGNLRRFLDLSDGSTSSEGDDRCAGSFLVCTDAACRGIDFPALHHVVQFDFATNVVDFIHRTGRTARGGLEGSVLSLYTKSDEDLVKTIFQSSDVPFGAGGVVEMAPTKHLASAFSRRRGLRKKLKRLQRDG